MEDVFAAYRLPVGIAEGVKIALPNTPAVFTVKLPSIYNDYYQSHFMAAMSESIDVTNGLVEANIDPAQVQGLQKEAFFSTCIVRAEGLPEGMNFHSFFATYPLAARYVMDEANKLVAAMDEKIGESLGNSNGSPSGRGTGADVKINMKSSKKVESESQTPAAALN